MKLLLLSMLAAACTACVHSQNAGPYPRNFNTTTKMYLAPGVARLFYGPPVPIPDPLASGYVVVDENGQLHVSPKLRAKLK